ncbi:MAG: hypothetical protein M1120_04005 [Patescibacteria group bacterium]|nr:hypothetical protein [Patescibacteria group bacterium]
MAPDRNFETGKNKAIQPGCEWFDPPPGVNPNVAGITDEVARMMGKHNFTTDSKGNRVSASGGVSGEGVGIKR